MNWRNIKQVIVLILVGILLAICAIYGASCSFKQAKETKILSPIVGQIIYAKLFKFEITYTNNTTITCYIYSKDRYDAERSIATEYMSNIDSIKVWEETIINTENEPYVIKRDSTNKLHEAI